MGIKLLSLVLCFGTLHADARPISYSGGTTLMAFTEASKDSIYLHYSPTYQYSIGVEGINDHFLNQRYSHLRLTYLVNRKNTARSQRNLYLQTGVNPADLANHFYGVNGDWETRRWFTGFGYKETKNSLEDCTDQYVQVGVAPYLGEFGDLHTWLMLKTKKSSLEDEWSTFPVLKFFKGNLLIEFGYHEKTEWDAHIMYRF